MLMDKKLEQIKLYLDKELIRKYVDEGKLFNDKQDYCRFMFALGVMNIDKKDKMEKYFKILQKRKLNEETAGLFNYHFGQFNKSLRIKELANKHFAYLGETIEVFDCINAVIIKSECLIDEKDYGKHFLPNNYVDIQKF